MQKENGPTVNLGKYDIFKNHSLGKGATGVVYKG